MKNENKKISRQKGFSLIELMIVVAIIGILTAMAVPNFQRFQLKSKQAEAKNHLAALYTANKAFHQEWSQYYDDFVAIGYAPEGQMNYQIAAGNGNFNGPSAASGYVPPNGAPDAGDPAVLFEAGSGGLSDICNGNPMCNFNTDHNPSVSAFDLAVAATTATTFTAYALSDIDRDGVAAEDDQWTIDQTKTLDHVTNDID